MLTEQEKGRGVEPKRPSGREALGNRRHSLAAGCCWRRSCRVSGTDPGPPPLPSAPLAGPGVRAALQSAWAA